MQAGSTGLGSKVLKFRIKPNKIKAEGMPPTYPKSGDLIIMGCKTYDPVVWNIWVAIEKDDVIPFLKVALSKEVLSCVFRWLFTPKRKKAEAEPKLASEVKA